MKLSREKILEYLAEDGIDITTNAIPKLANKTCEFYFISKNKNPFILCGANFLEQILNAIDSKNFEIQNIKQDGKEVLEKDLILKGKANARDFLLAERTALNLMQQLSAVSTKTYSMKRALEGSKIEILDTRKTIPALRSLQKYAVRCGGGKNHRFGLHDLVMIKDNHIKASGGIKQAITSILNAKLNTQIEVECESLEDVKEAVKHPIHIIMLDNMTIEEMREASKIIRTTNIKIEVSGGVSLENIATFKGLDVDFISSGSLTHSINAVDISAKILI